MPRCKRGWLESVRRSVIQYNSTREKDKHTGNGEINDDYTHSMWLHKTVQRKKFGRDGRIQILPTSDTLGTSHLVHYEEVPPLFGD